MAEFDIEKAMRDCTCGAFTPGLPADSWLQPPLPLYELMPAEVEGDFSEAVIWREDWQPFVQWVGSDTQASWSNSKAFIGKAWQVMAYRQWSGQLEDKLAGHNNLPTAIRLQYGQRSLVEYERHPEIEVSNHWPVEAYLEFDGMHVLSLANEVRRIDADANPVPVELLAEPLPLQVVRDRIAESAGSRTTPQMIELYRSVCEYVLGDVFSDGVDNTDE